MIDDILARLRQAHDDARPTPAHAIADRTQRVHYEIDYSRGVRGCDTRSVRHDEEPSADEIVPLFRPQRFAFCGRDGQGECSQELCYDETGRECPRAEACGITPVPGYSGKRGQLREV